MQLNQKKYQIYKKIVTDLCVGTQDAHAGRSIELLPWQLDLLQAMCTDDESGRPQYRRIWLELPRKNGKSFTVAILAIIGLLTVKNPSVICAASSRDQAKILYSYVFDMVQMSPRLKRLLKPLRHQIRVRNQPGHMKAISSDGKGQHGLNPSLVVADEVHTWSETQGRELWEALETSLGARDSTLIAITTAGSAYSFAWKIHDYMSKVEAGKISDPRSKAIIYKAPEDADPFDPEVWRIANPSLGHVLKLDYLQDMANKAKHDAQILLSFKKLHLNIWQGSASPYIMPEQWDAAAMPEFVPQGNRCWLGVDLSAVNDFTAYALFFETSAGFFTKVFYQITNHAWTKRLERYPDLVADWEAQGLIEVITGNEHSSRSQMRMIKRLVDLYDPEKILFDPWNAQEMSVLLEEYYGEGYGVAVPQNTRQINEPMKFLYKGILSGKIKHDGSPVTAWQIGNVDLQEDRNGNWYFAKDKCSDKIDGVAAMITAMAGYITLEARSYYESNSIVFV